MKKILLLVVLLSLVACTTTKNISPPPTKIPTSLSKAEAEYAIISALKDAPKENNAGVEITDNILRAVLGTRKQYWFYEGRGRDLINAGFRYRSFYMRAEVHYDDSEVNFKIVESRNLKQSGDSIHKKALVWLNYLERDVRATLGAFDRIKYEQELQNKPQKTVNN